MPANKSRAERPVTESHACQLQPNCSSLLYQGGYPMLFIVHFCGTKGHESSHATPTCQTARKSGASSKHSVIETYFISFLQSSPGFVMTHMLSLGIQPSVCFGTVIFSTQSITQRLEHDKEIISLVITGDRSGP